MPMRIGIFGGTFNPVHRGHTALAQAILEAGMVDNVWFMVSPQNPLKKDSHLLPEDIRLSLTRLAVRDIPGLEASDFEFSLPRPSFSYTTLQSLTSTFPSFTFSLIIGGDNWDLFPSWRCYRQILEQYSIIVYPRSDASVPDNIGLYPNVHFLAQAPLIPVSSTMIRRAIAAGDDVSPWLDSAVLTEINRLQLYR